MTLTPITINPDSFPADLRPLLRNAMCYDSACSPEMRVIFIDKDNGYFLKIGSQGALTRQAEHMRYFHKKDLTARVLSYISEEMDYLLTEKIHGDDCTAEKYLARPEKLCDLLAEQLLRLHAMDFSDCPTQNHTAWYLAKTGENYRNGTYNKDDFPDSFGYKNEAEAWAVVQANRNILQNTALIHGDYCLPNVMLNDWHFAGFIDLDNAGVGDSHVDIFWAIWSLRFNLHTDNYRQRFIDAYGRSKIDEEKLHIIAAMEVFL
ncbi:MAG: aminoglycoside 3'-phosphotransferase [Defluviitaleaceae bacterium]|nr:aminoglycoside 3'-phosphotransferase [Defluviitaleaceae bacterium]MCL2273887.1 aminoglycoside 3'-phosphotransferase [Defluviitaleaceae bacterium]